MKIQTGSSPMFNARLNTAEVLETTSQKIFYSDGTSGLKNVILALNDKPFKATGPKGYRHYAQIIGRKITDKYPKIKEATESIHKITKDYPLITKKELNAKIQPMIEEIGSEIDIVL